MEEKRKIRMRREGSKLFIGESPQLIVDLETQENYIRTGDRLIEYHRKVGLSPDLLAGKRANVLETALEAYYLQACRARRQRNTGSRRSTSADKTEIDKKKENEDDLLPAIRLFFSGKYKLDSVSAVPVSRKKYPSSVCRNDLHHDP